MNMKQNGLPTLSALVLALSSAMAYAQSETQVKPEVDAAAKPVQRVPYISEVMKAQIRNEIKEEILIQARAERWGVPNASPAWVDRIKIDGDMRYRHQMDRTSQDNTPAYVYLAAEAANDNGLSRAPDFASFNPSGFALGSTQDDRDRERIRLRLGLTAKVADEVAVGIRLATGNTTDRVSTNQTLGQGFNKYQLLVDRAFVRLDPLESLTLQAGRMPNPWFSTDMVWSENLNFEGLAATFRHVPTEGSFTPFATVGWFPLREEAKPARSSRSLAGAQLGLAWEPAVRTKFKAGLAYYAYNNMAGQEDLDYTTDGTQVTGTGPTYGQYEYTSNMRQKGNTVFETNPAFDRNQAPIWGLAYDFRPVVLTMSAELTHFSPYSLLLAAEFVKNTALDVNSFHRRAGASYASVNPGGRDKGYHLKLAFGSPEVREASQWQLSTSYRHVGSDAVLDAFTDSDLGLGGTNLKGFTLGGAYGLYRNATLGARYLSAQTIDTPMNEAYLSAKYKVNTLQVDLNVRF